MTFRDRPENGGLLHPYKPVPWETFTLIDTPASLEYSRTRAPMTLWVFEILAAIAVICGVLAAISH